MLWIYWRVRPGMGKNREWLGEKFGAAEVRCRLNEAGLVTITPVNNSYPDHAFVTGVIASTVAMAV